MVDELGFMNFAKCLWNDRVFAALFQGTNHMSWSWLPDLNPDPEWSWVPNGFLMPTYCTWHKNEWLLFPIKCAIGAFWDSDFHILFWRTKNIEMIRIEPCLSPTFSVYLSWLDSERCAVCPVWSYFTFSFLHPVSSFTFLIGRHVAFTQFSEKLWPSSCLILFWVEFQLLFKSPV